MLTSPVRYGISNEAFMFDSVSSFLTILTARSGSSNPKICSIFWLAVSFYQ
jgi:hypothetical protein